MARAPPPAPLPPIICLADAPPRFQSRRHRTSIDRGSDVITNPTAQVRQWLSRRELPWRSDLDHRGAFPGQPPPVVSRLARAVAHQVEAARLASRPPAPVMRDRRGRRLRATAYRYGPTARRRGRFSPMVALDRVPVLLKLPLVLVIAFVAFLGGSQAYVDYASQLPDAHAIQAPLPEDSVIVAADGTPLADVHPPGVQHYYEPYERMGRWLPEATVDIEDANFWNEPGIDVLGIARAAWIDWREHRPAQGASTITQQLVKLRLTGNELSLERKIREALLAIQVEQTYPKRQILEDYLNTVFYGNNAQGSLAASRIYFHKDTRDLDLAQAAMLAGIPQSPAYNDPLTNWSHAKYRQRQVLEAMVRHHDITQRQADEAYAEDLRPPDHLFTPQPEIMAAPGFTSWIIQQLVDRFGRSEVLGGGLHVATTLDMTVQRLAEKAVVDNVNANRYHGLTQGAMVALDPHTGAVQAMVGAAYPGQNGGQYNMAVWPPRNPGSSMKIYTYTAAIASKKFTMVTPIPDTPLSVSQGPGAPNYEPKNFDLKYHGNCQLQQCMGNSLNVPAVKVEVTVGTDQVAQLARAMGGPPWVRHPDGTLTDNDPLSTFGPSLTLGGYGETPLQQATGAATLADMGVYHPPYGISSVKNSNGERLFTATPDRDGKQVIDPRVAYIMQTIMSDDNNRAMIFGRGSALTLPGRRVAAKTGTTDDFRDAWTLGYSPRLASAFWFGNPDNAPLTGANTDAVYIAGPAWHNFMNAALNAIGEPAGDWFAEPPGLIHDHGALLLPGTSASQAAPPLPSYAHSSSGEPKHQDHQDHGDQGDQGDQGGGG
jgi:membrane peptidoglycan carboxypeptidase